MKHGVLVIDKPAGMTSHDVVDRIRARFRVQKVGHAGTLDPDATGILLIGLGAATRFLSYAQQGPKRYRAAGIFGVTTSTQDAAGEIVGEADASHLTEDEVKAATKDFIGEIDQVPPMVSAVRVAGQRLHKLARMGKEVDRPPRRIVIEDLDVIGFTPGPRPRAVFDVRCSGGTYVRTLVHDIGASLGTGAHTAELRRTEAGGFTLEDAVRLDDAGPEALLPIAEAVRTMYRFEVDSPAAALVRNGRPLNLFGARLPGVAQGDLVAVTSDGDLIAVYLLKDERLMPDRVVGIR